MYFFGCLHLLWKFSIFVLDREIKYILIDFSLFILTSKTANLIRGINKLESVWFARALLVSRMALQLPEVRMS